MISGPRQTGKTTLARQAIKSLKVAAHYASADDPVFAGGAWIQQNWETARVLMGTRKGTEGLLVLDEVQKMPDWAEQVKKLWDQDAVSGRRLKVVLLGSSALLVRKGAGESLAGRFEVIHVPHWSYGEMRSAFDWSMDQYVYYGGYPGAASLVSDGPRWAKYISESLIETTLAKDVLMLARVDKPALLRRLFGLACEYSGQILSYQKMLGQLQDAGNTTTLAHYLELLKGAGLVMGLQKYAGDKARQRGSSPKLQVLNNALMTASRGISLEDTRKDGSKWGRLVESCVGSHLVNSLGGENSEVFYWRDSQHEVDFVVKRGSSVASIEVKSGRNREYPAGAGIFAREFHVRKSLLIGEEGISLENFLSKPAANWL